MSQNILPVWKAIEKHIDDGISIIPVRDKDDKKGKIKTPTQYGWKEYQKKIIDKGVLFEEMDNYNNGAGVESIAAICGAVSGNMEIIDIDVKYNPDIVMPFFNDLREFYPEILSVLRVHKTPSGGFHLIYRCTEAVDGNKKLAGRPATDSELIKNKDKNRYFIETRGEGGYALYPPSLGYTVKEDNPIPVLTGEQRQSLISFCKGYSTAITPALQPYKPTKQESSIYSTNPFEDFNLKCDPVQLMQQLGWRQLKSNHRFILFERPNPKNPGRASASFNLHTRFFYCFTTQSELESMHGYTPANLYCKIGFNNDWKLLYKQLTSEGYGVYSSSYQRAIKKRAIYNPKKELPVNLPVEVREEIQAAINEMENTHPFGIFWTKDKEDNIIIDGENFLSVSAALGFRLNEDNLVRIQDQFIYKITNREYFDVLKQYINPKEEAHEIRNVYEQFIERHGVFRITRLPIIDYKVILQDDRHNCYKCFENGVLHITEIDVSFFPFSSFDKLIWFDSIKKREFHEVDNITGSLIHKFLTLAIGPINNYLLSVIGYLVHEYKDETMGYIIILSEQCEHPEDGGGSGKNIFTSLLSGATSLCSKPGSQTKFDERFFQSWDGARLFSINDVPKDFPFMFLKDIASNSAVLKKLFKDERNLTVKEIPKLLVSTNYSYQITDGGLRRRCRPVEFTNFFTLTGGVDVHFKGVHFPGGWLPGDWNAFDSIIALAVQTWLQNGCKLVEPVLSTGGWLKQFEQTFGQVITGFIQEHFESWKGKYVSNSDFKIQLEVYCRENGYQHQPNVKRLSIALRNWCEKQGVKYTTEVQIKEAGYNQKYRVFGDL